MTEVKPNRRERAQATRRRIAEAAYELFAAQGYAATTMVAVARAAGVAIQTVYFTFHTKAEVLIEAITIAGGGPGAPAEVMSREWVRDAIAADDGGRRLALIVENGTEIYRRLAPIFRAVSAAASVDPDVEQAWKRVTEGRRTGMRRFMEVMDERGELRPGLAPGRAADILSGISRHDVFLAFIAESGWSVEEYKAWVFATLARELLDDAAGDRALAPNSTATVGLSFVSALRALGI